jgi:hypothetical protein
MAVTSVDLDPELMERARPLTGERSNRAVLDLALRRLITSKQKDAMIDSIAALTDLDSELGAQASLGFLLELPSRDTPSRTTRP